MPIVVHKYGGSSVADAEKIKHVAGRIARACKEGYGVAAVVSAMGDTTDDLIGLAQRVSKNPDRREMDVLLSTGEVVSCALVAMALKDLGVDSVSLTGLQAGIATDRLYGKARILKIDPKRMQEEISRGRVVIVCGFQGFTPDMDVTTLGRGGSDTTAVAVAAALSAERCDIYTDVEGIYTTDPRIVPEARRIPEVSYEEMLELAFYGAKMHPRSIELGAVYGVPIYVASTFVDKPGTLIHGGARVFGTMEDRRKVTGVAIDRNVARITVAGVPDRPGVAAALFEPLAEQGISVDTIVQNVGLERTTDVSFTVGRTDLARAVTITEGVAESIGGREVTKRDSLAKVSVVGAGMTNAPGYAARMFRALAEAGINIEMITTSEIRITCIVELTDAEKAVRVLHRAFELERTE